MSVARAQETILLHLTDPDALAVLAREGLSTEVYEEDVHQVVSWAIDQFQRSGLRQAPSIQALVAEFGEDWFEDREIDLEEEPEDSVEWAIDTLQGGYVQTKSQEMGRKLVEDVHEATPTAKAQAFRDVVSEINRVTSHLETRHQHQDHLVGMENVLRVYEQTRDDPATIRGAAFGMDMVDQHTHGIHQGELALVAAGPKVGKSWMMNWLAAREFQRGRKVMIVTLENSVQMTWQRIACMMAHVDYERLQNGDLLHDEYERVAQVTEEIQSEEGYLAVRQPDMGQRSVEAIVAQAQAFGAETLLIDQLTFVELPETSRMSKTDRIGIALHTLKSLISTGREPMSCIMAHQINREGVKQADKAGYLEMYFLADSAETERTADWVFGLYASRDDRIAQRVKMQILASRRAPITQWDLTWQPHMGNISCRGPFELPRS